MKQKDLEYLIELGKKMNLQSPRSTQFPMFVVKQKVKVYGDKDWCAERERREDYDSAVCETCETNYADGAGEDYPDDCSECDEECFVHFNWEDEIVEVCGSFFTAEEAQKHIDLNSYHYRKPFVFGIPSWRNPEMQRVLNILSKLGGGVQGQYK